MGFPVGTTVISIFLCIDDIVWLEKHLPESKLVVYNKYIYDGFLFAFWKY